MLSTRVFGIVACVGAAVASHAPLAHAQSQAFTYQGELRSGNALAQGPHDLRFELLDGGGVIRQTLCADNVPVTDGRFTVQLDPGAGFPDLAAQLRNIRVLVRANAALPCSDSSGFTALSPTQPFTRAPLASRASIADRAVTADTLGGQPPAFYTDAANLSGILPDARLSINVPRLATNNVFTGANSFGSVGIRNAIPVFPLDIAASQAVANLASTNSPNGSVIGLGNYSPNIFTNGGVLGAVNFDAFGSTPGQISYRLDAAGPLSHSLRFRVGDVTQATLTGNGRLGIGNETPLFPLDIAATQAIAKLTTLNNADGSILTLANGSPGLATNGGTLGAVNFESGIGVDGQISYAWDPDSSLADALLFRVGGLPWAVLTGEGELGIGVLEPASRLHVRNGLSFIAPNASSTMVMENAAGGYFNLITQDLRENGLLFGTPSGGAEDAGIIYNNPAAPNGLQFRTGGNVTQMSIYSNGLVYIPGVLVSGNSVVQDVQYVTPRITFATIVPADFDIVTSFNSVKSLGFGEYATIPSGFVNDHLTAGVHLPNGATVTQVIAWIYDTSSTKNLTAQFVQIDQFTRSPALRGSGTSATSSIFNQSVDCTPVPNLTINNEASFYRIVISTANNQPWDGALGIAGIKIEYEMISPIP